MTASMTAFGRVEASTDFGQVTWEIRTVNHRYLDMAIRLPEEFRMIENTVRERIGKKLNRGKVDCNLRFEAGENNNANIPVNEALARKLVDAVKELNIEGSSALNPFDVLRWPGVIKRQGLDIEEISSELLSSLDTCLSLLLETRNREGDKLKSMLIQRCDAATEQMDFIRHKLPEIASRIKERYVNKAADLQVELDPERLEQEMLILAQKMDVAEELDRLDAHVEEVRRVLDNSAPAGRRLDFLMQEMNREANTLGSKAANIDMSNVSVELKVLIEQMREQVQNIE